MAITRFNVATINTSSAGLATIPAQHTIVAYNGASLRTPDVNGVFQNLSIPLGLIEGEVAFGAAGGSITSSVIFSFATGSNRLSLYDSSTEEGVFFSLSTIKKIDVVTDTTPTALAIEGSAGIISGSGGGVNINAGNAGFDDAFGGTGGYITLQAGSGSATETTFIQIAGGGGGVVLNGGAGGASAGTPFGGLGGPVQLNAGAGGDSTNGVGGSGGNVFLTAGTAGSGALGSGAGGNIEIVGGQAYNQGTLGDAGYIKLEISSRSLGNTLSNASIRLDPSRYAKNILIGWSHLLANQNPDAYFIISGSSDRKTLFIGDVVSSGSMRAELGFSGSLTKLIDGTSYLIAGTGVEITSQSNGAVTIAASSADTEIHATGSVLTTDATVTLLQTYTLTNNSVYTLEYKVVAGKDDLTETAQFIREVHAFNLSGSTTIQNIAARISDYKTDSAWNMSIIPNGAGVELWVTGTLTDNIRWKSNLNAFRLIM